VGEAPQQGEILPSSQLEEGEEIILENEYVKVVLTSRGGIVKSWYLKKEKKELVGKSTYSLGLNLFLPEGERINLSEEDFEVEKEGERKAVFIWEDKEGRFKLFKNLEISRQGYHVFLSIETVNLPLGSSYELTWPSMMGDEYKEEERLIFFNDKLQEEKKEGVQRDYGRGIKWMGLRQKRELLVILASLDWPRGGMFRSEFWGFEDNKSESRWIVYAGPQNYGEIRSLNDRIKGINGEDYNLTGALDLSIWGQLSVGLIKILLFFYGFTHNYGIAIVLLTLLIYGALFPLTFKQFTSMHKMQVIQPEVKAVQAKFKGDPKQMQIEMMKIYKKHKVNPMSGCFPLIIQMPIIFVLYRALLNFNFSENPSFLWIKNLGEPNIPLLLALGVTMFLQQRITQKTQVQSAGQQQGMAKMMQFFPIFIIVMLWSLPSGVMLYWFTSTLFSIFQQFLIRRRMSPSQPAKNVK
jgi:YidC/Oxa1 family membrane protein insertase